MVYSSIDAISYIIRVLDDRFFTSSIFFHFHAQSFKRLFFCLFTISTGNGIIERFYIEKRCFNVIKKKQNILKKNHLPFALKVVAVSKLGALTGCLSLLLSCT